MRRREDLGQVEVEVETETEVEVDPVIVTVDTSAPEAAEQSEHVPPDTHVEATGGPDAGATTAVSPVVRVDEARRRLLRRWAVAAGSITAVAVVGATLTSTSLFAAKTIRVAGADRLSETRIMRLAGVGEDTNVFRLDEEAIARRLESDPWIADASVGSSLPSTVRIDVVERAPVIVARIGEDVVMIAADGTALAPAPPGAKYPIGVAIGSSADPQASITLAATAVAELDAALRKQVRSVVVDPAGTMSLQLGNGVTVTYGSPAELEAKGEALRAILRWAEEQPRGLRSIDLTVPGAPTARLEGLATPTSAPGAWPASDEPASSSPPPAPAD